MSFLRSLSFSETPPPLQGSGIELRAPEMRDYEAWSNLRSDSRGFLTPWEPIWPPADLTRAAYRARLRRYARDIRADAAYPYFIFRSSDDVLVGGLTLGQVRRGVAQAASVGYWMGEPYAGHGHMTAAVRTLAAYAFGKLGLRRIEAACLPNNIPSIKLLERVGFTREGYARSYLCIAGEWRDHLLYALLSTDAMR